VVAALGASEHWVRFSTTTRLPFVAGGSRERGTVLRIGELESCERRCGDFRGFYLDRYFAERWPFEVNSGDFEGCRGRLRLAALTFHDSNFRRRAQTDDKTVRIASCFH